MAFKNLKPTKFFICAPRIYLPEVQKDASGEINVVQVCQSKVLPDPVTTKVSVQLAAGVPLKKTSTVMMRDVSGVSAQLQAALDADEEFKKSQKKDDKKSQKKDDSQPNEFKEGEK